VGLDRTGLASRTEGFPAGLGAPGLAWATSGSLGDPWTGPFTHTSSPKARLLGDKQAPDT
jgi:hypothetical protein